MMTGRAFLGHVRGFGVAGGTRHMLLCAAKKPWGSLELTLGPAVLRQSNLGYFKWTAFRSSSIAVKLPVNISNTFHCFLSAKEREALLQI